MNAITIADPAALVADLDARVIALPPNEHPARLYAVHQYDDGPDLWLIWSGIAREMPADLAPPADAVAILLECSGWAAPTNPDGSVTGRPSQHPDRRRVHHTALVTGGGEDYSVLRYDDEAPIALTDGVGIVLDLMRACWARRTR